MSAITGKRNAFRRGRLHTLVAVGILLALTGLLFGCGGAADEALAVDDVAADPLAYSGDISVVGIVQEVNAAEFRIVLIDQVEYETCGLFPCAGAGLFPLHIPLDGSTTASGAQYEGSLPELEQSVVVYGRITGAESDIEFDVDRIELSGKTIVEKK